MSHIRELILIIAKVSAIEVYGRAVAAEEIGDLDTALQLYRTAFRKYDAVDRLWRAAESQRSQLLQNVSSSSEAPMQKDDNRVDVLEATVQDMAALSMGGAKASVVAQQAAHTASVTGILETVLADFPPMIRFELEELAQERSATIDSVPDEVLVKVLLHLNPQSIERFALVSRKGRVVTLDAGIWRCGAYSLFLHGVSECGLGTLHRTYTSLPKSRSTTHSKASWNGFPSRTIAGYTSPSPAYVSTASTLLCVTTCTIYVTNIVSTDANGLCSRNGLSENAWVNVRSPLQSHALC
jgi:hypothetical protein